MKKILFFLCIVFFAYAEEEMQVTLRVEKNVYPIYVSDVIYSNATFSTDYLEKIKKVFLNDFQFSGYFSTLKKEKSKELVLSYDDLNSSFDIDFWKDKKARYVFRLRNMETDFFVSVLDTLKNEKADLNFFALSGDLSKDRRKVHKTVDKFVSEYLGRKSICTSKIVYTVREEKKNFAKKKDWISEIWMCDFDGANAKKIFADGNYSVTPEILNDDKIMFVSYKDGVPKLFSYKNKKIKKLVSLGGNQLLPSVSFDKEKIAFISDVAGRPDLFLYDLKSKHMPLQLYSYPRATQASSSFSPDGNSLAFVSDKDGSPRIYLIRLPKDFKRAKRPYAHLITKKNRYNVTPSFSFDGSKLAYSSKVNGVRQIFLYDFDLDKEEQLTKGKENKENPKFAMDNLHIIYNTEEKNSCELYILNINNKNAVRVSSQEGQKRFPVWFEKTKK